MDKKDDNIQIIKKFVNFLEEGIGDVNKRTGDGSTSLIFASDYNDEELVSKLLKLKADPNIQNNNGDTALIISENIKIAQMLIDAKADINLQNTSHRTFVDSVDEEILKNLNFHSSSEGYQMIDVSGVEFNSSDKTSLKGLVDVSSGEEFEKHSIIRYDDDANIIVYKSKQDKYIIAKKFINIEAFKQETEIIEYIKNFYCEILFCKILYDYNTIIFPRLDGDLNNLFKAYKISASQRLEILIKIIEQVGCLLEYDCYYVDIKFGNILYKWSERSERERSGRSQEQKQSEQKQNIEIILGDLGSIYTDKTLYKVRSTLTFDSFLGPTKNTVIINMINSLKILLFEMFGGSVFSEENRSIFYVWYQNEQYDDSSDFKPSIEINKFIDAFCKTYPQFIPIVRYEQKNTKSSFNEFRSIIEYIYRYITNKI